MFPLTALLGLMLTGMPVDPNAGQSPLTTFREAPVPEGTSFDWNDAEDVVRGTVTPANPREGEPVTFTFNVAAQEGAAFDGPVTFSMRPRDELGGDDSVTVSRKPGDRLWTATLTPHTSGLHRVDVSFRTTHFKVVRGELTIGSSRLPSWLLFVVAGVLLATSLGLGVWVVLRNRRT